MLKLLLKYRKHYMFLILFLGFTVTTLVNVIYIPNSMPMEKISLFITSFVWLWAMGFMIITEMLEKLQNTIEGIKNDQRNDDEGSTGENYPV